MSKFMWGNSKSLSPEGMTDAEMSKRLFLFFTIISFNKIVNLEYPKLKFYELIVTSDK